MPHLQLSPVRAVRGHLLVPGDKSISHRYVLLSALADGRSTIDHLSPGADVAASLGCVEALGARVDRLGPASVHITGQGHGGLRQASGPLACLNSGTTMRLLAGIVAGLPFVSKLTGDDSLSRRPMGRIIDPLTRMGARIESQEGRAPLVIQGGPLRAVTWAPPVASAQIKSAVLLAGLSATGTTVVHEPAATRDHTERAFPLFGLRCDVQGLTVSVAGGQRASAPTGVLTVPGDPSSAAVWAAAAAALPGSSVQFPGVALNPRRLGFLTALTRLGARVTIVTDAEIGGESVGTIAVAFGDRQDTTIGPDEVPDLIDELPVLAAVAAFGRRLEVRGAGELRVKESDRITALVTGLRALGVEAEEFPDGFAIDGTVRQPRGGEADAAGDHRLVMAFTLIALGASGPTGIRGAERVAVSYPAFIADLQRLTP